MTLVFGGAYQGKLDYVMERFGLTDGDVFCCSEEDMSLPQGKRAVNGLDKWLLALVKGGGDVSGMMAEFIEKNGRAVVICNDVSCGVVPADYDMRRWRETVGRAMVELSRASEETIRLFCGIPTKVR